MINVLQKTIDKLNSSYLSLKYVINIVFLRPKNMKKKKMDDIYKILKTLFRNKMYNEIETICDLVYQNENNRENIYKILNIDFVACDKSNNQNRKEKVLRNLLKYETIHSKYFDSTIYIELSKIYYNINKKDKALGILNKGLKLSVKYNNGELLILKTIYKMFTKKDIIRYYNYYNKIYCRVLSVLNIQIPSTKKNQLTSSNLLLALASERHIYNEYYQTIRIIRSYLNQGNKTKVYILLDEYNNKFIRIPRIRIIYKNFRKTIIKNIEKNINSTNLS